MIYSQYLKERFKDPRFEKLILEHPERYQVAIAIIKTRFRKGWSQRYLAKKAKTTQAVISRVENMNVDSTVRLIRKIAVALGKRLEISFVFPA
ncbi:transcriptional regulator [Candidatus Beckwithbacteria bacterium CG22_combo_CG10-13_8_21_14_all_01_47_9]|uniref:Transcriptional regulator n=4 Tax=Candidatus Beckwithiibacteriota TaxID=1752726 RepID=A0A2H0E1V1_9BACT|nr:MAG: hypothetical protein AUJ59_03120 [Candidatus Beckwithbacteria bacterium CG1_02_47_37]PIP52252.1 MAG: transcriptional regulator [Candidatus Beckwithbacteria bacterium CG23_combo_of_CG06-09_8_20_14_all_47_9]PIP88416.1 MAG: transcriptional regulator [Candidatus Beckwithbacteria bacterium CG22_combo_CG10-13_8_21_14_all_01_47_9]PJA21498.1 MAG: transcriptional regulator [Candidatus Beckwithbacteria bacterium CG_4_10_14_0_2_um_filter_47_25]